MPMDVMAVLKRHKIRPSKGLGQSFLLDHDVLQQIVEASELTSTDVVLEVGPGLGQLTRRWLSAPAQWWRSSWMTRCWPCWPRMWPSAAMCRSSRATC